MSVETKKSIIVIGLACPSGGGKGEVSRKLQELAKIHGCEANVTGSQSIRDALKMPTATRAEIRRALAEHPCSQEPGFPLSLYLSEDASRDRLASGNGCSQIRIVDGVRTLGQMREIKEHYPLSRAAVLMVWIRRDFAACVDALVSRDSVSQEFAERYISDEYRGTERCIELAPVREQADYVLKNSGTLEDLRCATETFWRYHVAPLLPRSDFGEVQTTSLVHEWLERAPSMAC